MPKLLTKARKIGHFLALLVVPTLLAVGNPPGAQSESRESEAAPPVPLGNVPAAACRFLDSGDTAAVRHEPDNDVRYRPGQDARGDDVAPARLGDDYGLGGTPGFRVRISVGLAEYLAGGREQLRGASLGSGTVATLAFEQGGLYLNGRPLNAPARDRLARACSNGEDPDEP